LESTRPIIYAFIDSQNLNLSVSNDEYDHRSGKLIYRGWKLDFSQFFIYLKDKYKVQKAFLFIGKIPGNESLYDSLSRFGYTLIFKPTLTVNKGGESFTKGNVDAELVLHSMIEYPNYSKAIIVSGDGDYHCLIEYLHIRSKLSQIMIPNRYSYSSLLREYRDYFVFISDQRERLELKSKKRE
jgi:uncharacterized LabA/DUF88 family protein